MKDKKGSGKQLIESESEDDNKLVGTEQFDNFKINEKFKSKYEHNERRKMLEKGILKYGDLLGDGEDGQVESSESSSSDDSDAELLNAEVERKFMETMAAIRNNDPSLRKMDENERIFKDEDFAISKKQRKDRT